MKIIYLILLIFLIKHLKFPQDFTIKKIQILFFGDKKKLNLLNYLRIKLMIN